LAVKARAELLLPATLNEDEPQEDDEDDEDTAQDDEDLEVWVEFPYPKHVALRLWLVWRDKGVMARAGGYLDQPLAWQRLIFFMDTRYAKVYDAIHKESERIKEMEREMKAAMGDGWDNAGDLLDGF
jgi:hypothetical protein